MAELPKVMPHIEIPIQAGDDEVLKNMRRGYTQADYRAIVQKIRERIPVAPLPPISSSAFPARARPSSWRPYHLLEDLRLDVAHLARYSVRPGTVAERRFPDDVPEEEKMRRFRMLEELQEQIVGEINSRYLGKQVEVLFEDKVKGRWRGRTPTNKLVFVEAEQDLRGKVIPVTVTWTGPWSMQARIVVEAAEDCQSGEMMKEAASDRLPSVFAVTATASWWRKGMTAGKARLYYRPLGGTIEFGEHGVETVRREFQEEIGTDLTEVRYLGMLENIFTYEGRRGHEIVLVYDGRLCDSRLYAEELIQGDEFGHPFKAVWKRLDEFGPGKPPVYPDGLLALLGS